MNEELKIIISAETSKLKSGVNTAKTEVNGFKAQLQKASAEVDNTYKQIGDSISNGLKTAGAAGVTAIAGIATALIGTAAATEEYRASQAKLNAAFTTAGASAETAKSVYNDLYRVLGEDDTSVEAANHLAKLTTNEKELSEWTNICQGVYATFGASLPIEGLTEAANETAKVGTVTGGLADALNWAGVSEDAFNEKLAACNTEAEREKLIRETLSGIYDKAATNYEKTAASTLSQNEAQAKLTDTIAQLGEAMQPVITAFTSFAADALAKVTPYVKNIGEKYGPKLSEALKDAGEKAKTVISLVVDNWKYIAAIAGVIGGITAAIGLYNAVAAVKAAMAAAEVTTVWALVAAYAAQAAAMVVAIAPYVLIVAAIAAVVAAIIYCVKNWDKIKAKTAEVWAAIKAKVSEGVSAVKNKFNEMTNSVTGKARSIKSSISNTFNSIKSTISEKINGAKDAVKSAIDKIKGFLDFNFKLPKIKLPKISVTGKLDLFNIPPKVPKLSISWNALGGVFDKPTIFGYGNSLQGIGENGAEAVVPLEKNTAWLDRLATMLNEKQGSQPIVLTVDGKVLAETTVSGINNLTRQRGSLPLVLA